LMGLRTPSATKFTPATIWSAIKVASLFISTRAGIQLGASRELPDDRRVRIEGSWWLEHLDDAHRLVELASCELPRRGPFLAFAVSVASAAIEAAGRISWPL
jgi:hypothetical protein